MFCRLLYMALLCFIIHCSAEKTSNYTILVCRESNETIFFTVQKFIHLLSQVQEQLARGQNVKPCPNKNISSEEVLTVGASKCTLDKWIQNHPSRMTDMRSYCVGKFHVHTDISFHEFHDPANNTFTADATFAPKWKSDEQLNDTKTPNDLEGDSTIENLNEEDSEEKSVINKVVPDMTQLLNKTVTEDHEENPTLGQVWGLGLLSVTIISLSGLFGAILWPLMKSKVYVQMMQILIGLAVGSLTATSTFQLIPEAFKMRDYSDTYLITALFMWSSIWGFYMFEVISKIIFYTNKNKNQEGNVENTAQSLDLSIFPANTETSPHVILEQDYLLPQFGTSKLIPTARRNSNQNTASSASHTSLHKLTVKNSQHLHTHEKNGKMATVAWMIIFGDGLHNFIDGMSVGAGFSKSVSTGLSISIAIACEEFPHELGDFAILINSGMPVKKALLYNFLSACTSYAGLVLGILLGELEANVYIFAFAGGLFLYISLTDLMPELNSMIDEGLQRSTADALFILLLQNCGIFAGMIILYLITNFPINVS